MKRFDKNKQLRKLHNRKNNSNTKIITIVLSITILVGAIIYFTFARFESSQNYSLISGTATIIEQTIPEKMMSLAAKGATDLIYDGTDSLGEYGTTDNNLRYTGLTPNNYIYYNCSTSVPGEMNDETCEKWRIIGLFNNVEDKDGNLVSRVKIIRDESLGKYSFDTSTESVNYGGGISQWGESTYNDGTTYEGADIMRELNTDYLGNITVATDGKWYSAYNDEKESNMPSSTLNEYAQEMIEPVVWHAGATEFYEKIVLSYESEKNSSSWRGTDNSQYQNDTVVRNSRWFGKVGLMNFSDFAYSTAGGSKINYKTCIANGLYYWSFNSDFKDCYENTWINSEEAWTMNFRPGASAGIFTNLRVLPGAPGNSSSVAIKPAVYLKDSITILSGNGSSTNPYKLKYEPKIIKYFKELNTNDLEYDGVETLGDNGTPDNNLRYVGANPNNYVYFNCSTTDSANMNSSTCETWRIVGIFNNIENSKGIKAPRIKIKKDKSIGSYSWDSSDSTINRGFGINQWGESTYTNGDPYEGADIMRELNTDYLGNITVGTDGKWYNGSNNSKTNMPSKMLSASAVDMIEEVKWNLGSPNINEYHSLIQSNEMINSLDVYKGERSNYIDKVCANDTNCSDLVKRQTSWTGKVALIYASDYLYATSGGTNLSKDTCLSINITKWYYQSGLTNSTECNINSWLNTPSFAYTLTVNHEESALYIYSVNVYAQIVGQIMSNSSPVLPALYLKNNISIIGGNGTSANPYKLSF